MIVITLKFDPGAKVLRVDTNTPTISAGDVALLMSQGVTQCLLIQQQENALLINPLGGAGNVKKN